MKKIFVLGLVIFLFDYAVADVGNWVYKGMLGAAYNETQVSGNWSGGEKDSRNWSAKLDASVEKNYTKANWQNLLKTEYGKSQVEGSSQQESSDLFKFDSIYTLKLNAIVDPFVSGAIETQYSEFYDPVTYTETVGVSRKIIDTKPHQLKTRVGISLKQKLDKKDLIEDSVTGLPYLYSSVDNPNTLKIEESKFDIGLEWVTNYDWLISENSKFVSEAKVFNAFDGGVSVRWDNALYVKLSKYFTLQLGYLTIYEYNKYLKPVWPNDFQTRLTTALGFSYNLF